MRSALVKSESVGDGHPETKWPQMLLLLLLLLLLRWKETMSKKTALLPRAFT